MKSLFHGKAKKKRSLKRCLSIAPKEKTSNSNKRRSKRHNDEGNALSDGGLVGLLALATERLRGWSSKEGNHLAGVGGVVYLEVFLDFRRYGRSGQYPRSFGDLVFELQRTYRDECGSISRCLGS